MKLALLIIPFSLLICISCKSPKQANTTEAPAKPIPAANAPANTAVADNGATAVAINPDQKMEQIAKDTRYRLIVSLISIGEGTDRNGKEILDSFLNEWATKYKQEVGYETVNWGREGEVDFCFLISEMNESQQKQFVTEIKEKFKGHSLIQFTENEPCIHKR